MKEIYNGETVALGGPNLVTKELVVDDATGEKAKFTYDKTTGSVTVLDEVDPDSINPVTSRAVAIAVAGAGPSVEITVDQSYNASSENPQSGTAVAQAIGEVNGVPPYQPFDAYKFLTVDTQGSLKWGRTPSELVKLEGSESATIIIDYIMKGKRVEYYTVDYNTTTHAYVYNRYTVSQYIPDDDIVYLCGIYKVDGGTGDYCLSTYTISGRVWTATRKMFTFQ